MWPEIHSDIMKTENIRWNKTEDPVMVAPLFWGESTERVAGLILINEIPFVKLNPNSVRFLSVIADWISKAVDNAYATTDVRPKDIYDDKLKVFNYNYALRRLKEELVNVKASGRKSSLMLVKLKDYMQLDNNKKSTVFRTMAYVLTHILRGGDVVAKYLHDDTFLVFMSGTDEKGAAVVADRVKQEVDKFAFKPFVESDKNLDVNISTRLMDSQNQNIEELLTEKF